MLLSWAYATEVEKVSLIFGFHLYPINILQQLQAIKNSVWVSIPMTLTGMGTEGSEWPESHLCFLQNMQTPKIDIPPLFMILMLSKTKDKKIVKLQLL